MLISLHIENIAVIKTADIDFTAGFTVLTGETGAGKSIIIDSIALILGAKQSKELIRSGEETAMVSALFGDMNIRALNELFGVRSRSGRGRDDSALEDDQHFGKIDGENERSRDTDVASERRGEASYRDTRSA